MSEEKDPSAGRATSLWRGLMILLGVFLARWRGSLIRGLAFTALVGDLASHYLIYTEHHAAALGVKVLATACDLLARRLEWGKPNE